VNTVSVDELPGVAFEPYSFLLDNTGVEPIVERRGFGHLTLVHSSARVRMTITFKLSSGGKWNWCDSTLHIDGKKTALASSWDMYAAIFKDPDNGRRNFVPKGAKKAVLPESKPVDEQLAPAVVTSSADQLRKLVMPDKKIDIEIRISGASKYLVFATDELGAQIVYVFEAKHTGRWEITDVRIVTATGFDVTQHNAAHLESYILDFLGHVSRSTQQSTVPLGREMRAGGVENSVMVRKATVFRV